MSEPRYTTNMIHNADDYLDSKHWSVLLDGKLYAGSWLEDFGGREKAERIAAAMNAAERSDAQRNLLGKTVHLLRDLREEFATQSDRMFTIGIIDCLRAEYAALQTK